MKVTSLQVIHVVARPNPARTNQRVLAILGWGFEGMDHGNHHPLRRGCRPAARGRGRSCRCDRVGIAALFHWIEINYGLNIAYAAVAGMLVVLALLSAGIAVVLLKGKLPPIPRPKRHHSKAAGRSLAARAMLATTSNRGLLKTDATTEIMIGLAAACLVGWLAASRLGRSGGAPVK